MEVAELGGACEKACDREKQSVTDYGFIGARLPSPPLLRQAQASSRRLLVVAAARDSALGRARRRPRRGSAIRDSVGSDTRGAQRGRDGRGTEIIITSRKRGK